MFFLYNWRICSNIVEERVAHLYRCKVFVGRGIHENTIGLHRSEHQTDRFEGRWIGYEAGVFADGAFRSILVPQGRASVKIFQ